MTPCRIYTAVALVLVCMCDLYCSTLTSKTELISLDLAIITEQKLLLRKLGKENILVATELGIMTALEIRKNNDAYIDRILAITLA